MAQRTYNPVTKKWEGGTAPPTVRGTAKAPPPAHVPAAEQKKRDDQERADFERETGKKYGINELDSFKKWKQKRASDAAAALEKKKQTP